MILGRNSWPLGRWCAIVEVMTTLALTIKTAPRARQRKVVVEMDASKLERLAANFGLLNPDFLASVARAERDYETGRVRKVRSLKELIS